MVLDVVPKLTDTGEDRREHFYLSVVYLTMLSIK